MSSAIGCGQLGLEAHGGRTFGGVLGALEG
jgi:hypothetical protein